MSAETALSPEFKYFGADVFSNVYDGEKKIQMPKSLQILGFSDDKNPAVPQAHENYVFRREVLRDLLGFLRKPNNDALFITGPTGSGKTSAVLETCARLNWPVSSLTLNARFEFAQLIGHFTFSANAVGEAPQMRFQYGPLAVAMRFGHVLVLNEVDLADAGELAGLNDVLEGRPLVLAENAGEIIRPHPMFRVICTANSCGNGDDSGRYAGVQQQNLAFLDRFRYLEVPYQDAKVEEELLSQLTPAMKPVLGGMVQLANEIRKLFTEGRLSLTLSTRTLVRWAQIAQDFRNSPNSLEYGLRRALLIRAEPEESQAIVGLCRTIFGDAWSATGAKK